MDTHALYYWKTPPNHNTKIETYEKSSIVFSKRI